MLGVVIWSDDSESKAIIWCEDHGELAFFGNTPHAAAGTERFDEGDLIQFDLAEYQNLRLARNPRKIAGHYCSSLSDVIAKAAQVKAEIESSPPVTSPVQLHDDTDRVVDISSAPQLRQAS